jgi:hypothetical protein
MTSGGIGALVWLRILCATLLLSLGLAHKPVYAQPRSDGPASIAYRLPDGTYASICYDGGRGGRPEKVAAYGCDFCRIADSLLLPDPASELSQSLTGYRDLEVRAWVGALDPAPAWPGAPVRGPPRLSA